MVIAYLRVSTSKQHLVNQQDEIRRFAHTKEIEVSRWVTEIVSGKKNQKERKLGRVINQLKPGDTLIVTEISRLSRTLTEIMTIMGKCLEKNITIYSTKDGYAFDNTKQQSPLLCIRPCRRNRTEPYIYENQRSSCLTKSRRSHSRSEKGKYHQIENTRR